MDYDNEMTLEMTAASKNESFARVTVAAFASQLDPTIGDLTDIKTAVSEAVTNAIIHGYEDMPGRGTVKVKCGIKGDTVYIEISDTGAGIDDVSRAMTPLFTSKPEMERSGMGFTVMETFMDSIQVESTPMEGTTVRMRKKIART
ncbi:anti-sigma F factor [Tyzzerella sp. OttesenSCG-928-J15]|nr:anti-sigma F factor [Tyzzerella sp. OttesenSCG-928-J15]